MIPRERHTSSHASGIPANQLIAPGMMVSCNASPYCQDNGNVISKQGKLSDITSNGPIFAQHILNASNKAGDRSRPSHFKKETAASP